MMIETQKEDILDMKVLLEPNIIRNWLSKDQLYRDINAINTLDNWVPNPNDIYIACTCNYVPYGVIMLREFSGEIMTYHGGIYKTSRGKLSADRVKTLLNRVKALVPNHVLMTLTPITNTAAIRLNLAIGFKEKTTITTHNKTYILFGED